MRSVSLESGRPWPLGAHWDGTGVNFTLYSANAQRVELCLFDGDSIQTLALPKCTDEVWHGYLRGAEPGLRYAYRVYGPQQPGHRFDPRRLLLDPYAREVCDVETFSYTADPASIDVPKARVVDARYDWGDDAAPAIAWADSVFYEIHVKGATATHPDVPEALRGTYAGLAAPAMLAHYQRLGVTALNLLPVHCFIDEQRLVNMGLRNYWGYNTLAFFAPEPRYAAGGCDTARDEFRQMVRTLHAAGIEVILDVVFNHTAETDEFGPTISFRGIDNASYYRLPADDRTLYENFTGCGNTFNVANPRVLQLVMDALRYWVGEMHVDGFRFDLAATLTRDSGFLAAVAQDPLLARVKMIAEPWDLGPDGYRLGRFPAGWSEWNDRFRDVTRAYWLTGGADTGALAQRLAGSSEIFRQRGRAPQAGVNFITAHDGFTLRDLVSYAHKHNERNGENNNDGHGHNFSCNCGEEGESSNLLVLEQRRRLQRALLATLFVAQGVPMLQGGDEIGRTQQGNNNAYCQDNALTWLDWAHADQSLIAYTAGLIDLRRRFAQLRSDAWLTGDHNALGQRDVVWWHPEGREMAVGDWHSPHRSLGMLLAATGYAIPARPGPALLLLFNPEAYPQTFHLPPGGWQQACDSSADAPFTSIARSGTSTLVAHCVQILAQDRQD